MADFRGSFFLPSDTSRVNSGERMSPMEGAPQPLSDQRKGQMQRYDRVKQEMIDYHVNKMLENRKIMPIKSTYASPIVMCRKNNGLHPESSQAYRFTIDYRKLNVISKYPRYPLSLKEGLIVNIPNTKVMSTLDLRLGYFQLALNSRDIPKTAFVTKNGTYALTRMPLGLSGATPNFQKMTLSLI
ncbi:hypothetical protein TNCV_704131 [Trichonephila clavipes]|nr:hypothetical protein TNCV_704131 [Trichonephila clavipes]